MINMENGTIKWFDPESNFGYIERGNGDIDVFVHGDEIEGGKALNAGDKVTFEIKEGEGRPKAKNVSKA
jgi:CspA family cold shock protein